MSRRPSFFLVLITLILVLTACVQQSGSASIGAGTATGPTAKTTQASVSTWGAIKERGSFRLGVTPAEPWYFKDPQSGDWSGLGVALGQEIADAMGVKLELVETTWGNAVAALQANQIDVMFVLDPTPQRALSVDFLTTPLLYYALAVLHSDDLKVDTWDGLNDPNLEIGVTLGTSIDRFVTGRLPNAKINRFQNNDETVASFQSGRSDVVVMFHPALIALQRRIGRGTISLPKPVQFNASSAGVRREQDKTWRDYLSTVALFYYNSGKTQELYEEFLRSRGIDPASVPPIMKERFGDYGKAQ